MPGTIVDSLFLELGIDTTRLGADQVKALSKIREFESKAKSAGKGAAEPIQKVGDALRDIARDTRIGSGISRIEGLSEKFHALGKSLSVAGGVGAPLGAVTRGIGALLSPTALWGAAVAGVGAGMWDLNKVMTANNAAIYRQAQLTGTSAANMWAWAEAAKTVGANPMEISGGIAGLQTSLMGMGIGVGNASSQIIGLSRLGVPFNFQTGADIEALFTRVNALAAQRKFGDVAHGGQPLGALQALASQAGMNEAMWALATNPSTTPADIKKWITERQGVQLGNTLQESLKSQAILGKLGISKDILAETAYGGEQGLMQAAVELLTKILEFTNTSAVYLEKIYDAIPDAWKKAKAFFGVESPGAVPDSGTDRRSYARKVLIGAGIEPKDADAVLGNWMAESGMDPRKAGPGNHFGLGQWDAARQKDFAKMMGYQMTDSRVPFDKLFMDEISFGLREAPAQRALKKMAMDFSLAEKVRDFMDLDEVPKDNSFARRLSLALASSQGAASAQAMLAAANSSVSTQTTSTATHDYRFGDINVNSGATNGVDMARDIRRELASQPLLNPLATQTMTLATRGSQ